MLITGVLQNGPARPPASRPGDVVVKIAGKSVTSTSQLLNAVAALKPRETASIGVQRGSEEIDVPVVIAERPPARPGCRASAEPH